MQYNTTTDTVGSPFKLKLYCLRKRVHAHIAIPTTLFRDQSMMMKITCRCARLRVVYVDSRLYILERNFFRNKTRSTYVQTLNTALIFMYEQPHIR